jgi:ribosome biogenesis GTPase / thiamine phosphate phosphatase
MELSLLGWNAFFEEAFKPYLLENLSPARVAVEHRGEYVVICESETYNAKCSGRMAHSALCRRDYPAVGDWVAVEPAKIKGPSTIHGILPRRALLSRTAPTGSAEPEQVIAANVDTLFIVTGLDRNFNLRRIERYLTLGRDSGATPVVLLNKSDLCPEAEERRAEVIEIARGAAVITLSAWTGDGIPELTPYLGVGQTVALLGSSGVGKSTILNSLCGGEIQPTAPVRGNDSRGRHTSTSRHLISLPSGGLLIDTPGMREFGLWEGNEGLDTSFEEFAEIALQCRFTNCQHDTEPGCAIRAALESGVLDPARFESWSKLQTEQAIAAQRSLASARRMEAQKWKRISTQQRKLAQFRNRLSGGD